MCDFIPALTFAAVGGTQLDFRTNLLLAVVIGLLLVAYSIGRILKRQPESTASPAVVRTFNLRVRSWLLMFAVLVAGFVMGDAALGSTATVVIFGLISFWAFREFITMTPTRRADHRTLFWTFFLFTPLQYCLVGLGEKFYGLYTVIIPVYASLVIPARIALSGDPKRFLERAAKIQSGLLICVYSLSHAPALMTLGPLTLSDGTPWVTGRSAEPASQVQTNPDGSVSESPMPPMGEIATESTAKAEPAAETNPGRPGSKAGLLFFFILVVQLNDVLQYGWGQLLGKHPIAPSINASRTWEGFIGGTLTTMLIGSLLVWVTPFQPWEAACMAGAVAVMGSAGSLVMSAIKRDRGVGDYGTLIVGHAGVLDRIDSMCFAAPIFFHLTRYFFSS